MANNLYVNSAGNIYTANTPNSASDSQLGFPDPTALAVAPTTSATASAPIVLKAAVKLNKQQNGKMPATWGWDA